MPFALTTIGILLVVVGFQNTYKAFGAQVLKDFSGPQSFLYSIAAIGLIGSIGYIKELRPISNAGLTLLVFVVILSANKQGGFFDKFTSALNSGSSSDVNPIGTPLPDTGGNSGGGSGGGSDSPLSVIGDLAGFL